MTAGKPLGIAALLARMPRRFVAQARAVEARARRRRQAQAKRFEPESRIAVRAVDIGDCGRDEWQDTVAAFMAAEPR